MGVFARRCAPVQVNYLGFPGTLGADYMDYIVADQHVIPEAHQEFFTEKVVYMPDCYQANDNRKRSGPAISPARNSACRRTPSYFVASTTVTRSSLMSSRFLDEAPRTNRGKRALANQRQHRSLVQSAEGSKRSGDRHRTSRIRKANGVIGSPCAASIGRSVPGYAAVQRPYHR